MEIKKLNKFLFVILALFLFACNNPQSENPPIIMDNLSLGHKTDMTLVDSTNGNLTFLDTVKINEFKYLVKCVYKNDYDYPFFQLIKNGDTIEFERNELYVTDSIYDINNDNRDDFNIKYQATKGFIIFSYLFDKETNKLSTKPDTIYITEPR
ncbi:MAG: hypothetical protein PHI32_11740 [Dysgonamonadaceae bacterium]|nr:hypothetical protein [Dysgonamonadaceae bacterium]